MTRGLEGLRPNSPSYTRLHASPPSWGWRRGLKVIRLNASRDFIGRTRAGGNAGGSTPPCFTVG